jgi:hypothetical protein
VFGGGAKATPPPPPPPPPNPPTYARADSAGPISAMPSIYAGLGSTILTSPLGAPATGTVQRKSLLGS